MEFKNAEHMVRNDYFNEYIALFYYSKFIDTPKEEGFKKRVNPLAKIRRIEERYANHTLLKDGINSSKYLRTVNGLTDVVNKNLEQYKKTNDRKTLDNVFYLMRFVEKYLSKDI